MTTSPTRREIIFTEAAKLFREKGYQASSMRDLAQRVGIEVSSLYNHIQSKEEMLQVICMDTAHKFLSGLKDIEVRYDDQPAQQLNELIRLHVRIALGDPTSITVFNDEWRNLSEPHLEQFLEMRRHYEQRFLDILRKGIERGCFRKVNPVTALATILSSLRWLHDRHQTDRHGASDTLGEEIIALLTMGLVTTLNNPGDHLSSDCQHPKQYSL